MEPNIICKDNKIYVNGHYDNIIKCAKLDFLCTLFGAYKENGYAVLNYSEDFINKFKLIDDSAVFACTGGCSDFCGGGDCNNCGNCGKGTCTGACGYNCSGCSGGCGGDCNACAANCSSDCTTTCSTCSAGCSSYCSCGSTCGTTCQQGCSPYDPCSLCDGSCYTTCTGSCKGSCSTTCTGGCKGTCTSSCAEGCASYNPCSGCEAQCRDNCDTTCESGCTDNCNNGCTGSAMTPTYNYLSTLYSKVAVGDLITAEDFTQLELLVRNEVTRRKKTPTSNTNETYAEPIFATSAQKVYNDLLQVGRTTTSVSNGTILYTPALKSYVLAAKELYEVCIPAK